MSDNKNISSFGTCYELISFFYMDEILFAQVSTTEKDSLLSNICLFKKTKKNL